MSDDETTDASAPTIDTVVYTAAAASSSSSAAAAAAAAGVCNTDETTDTNAATSTIDINNTIDLSAATVIVASQIASSPPSASPPQVETILCRNVDCYVSGLLASFKRTTLNKMVHEVLILYPRSEYAIEMERPIIHQRRGGKGSKAK